MLQCCCEGRGFVTTTSSLSLGKSFEKWGECFEREAEALTEEDTEAQRQKPTHRAPRPGGRQQCEGKVQHRLGRTETPWLQPSLVSVVSSVTGRLQATKAGSASGTVNQKHNPLLQPGLQTSTTLHGLKLRPRPPPPGNHWVQQPWEKGFASRW